MKKILIIDSGMKNLGGHNFSYTRAVEDALKEKGFKIEVLANRQLPPEIAADSGYIPTFTHGAYDFPPPKNIRRVLAHLYAQSVIYADELEQKFENKLSDYDAVFSHTLTDFELIGWNRFLGRRKLDAYLLLLQRGTPNFQTMNRLKSRFHPYYRIKPHYLNAIHLKMNGRFTLLTDSDLLTKDFARVYKRKIVTLPIPMNKYFLAAEESYGESLKNFRRRYELDDRKGLCIGYLGDSRPTKGFDLLPQIVRLISAQRKDVHFIFQCPKPAAGNDHSSPAAAVEELYKLKREVNNLTLVSERLSEEDYANMFRCLDIVLVPYLLPSYTECTSGIFAEAAALGKPVLTTEKTWMAHELKRFGGGLETRSGDIEDITAKLLTLIDDYDFYAAKSRAYRREWCGFHNSCNLAEMLIAEIK